MCWSQTGNRHLTLKITKLIADFKIYEVPSDKI